jgi:ABC-2 type transport system ATP-binding protein
MYGDLTAGEYMALAARLSDVRPDLAIESMGLNDYLLTRMTHLSSSFQRRLALAAAMVASPDVLVLDEPTAGLDPVAAHDLHKYVREAMHGRTALLCTHNESDAQALCDEVVSLRGGRVVDQATGTWEQLRQRSRPRLRVAARQGGLALLRQLRDMSLSAEADEDDASAVLVSIANAQEEGPRLLRRLLDAGLDVYECTPVRPSLEVAFQEALR